MRLLAPLFSLTSRRLRLLSGIVLFAYLGLHMLNHSLGVITIDWAEAGLRWSMALWHSWPGTVALYGAAILHFALALQTVFTRRNWWLPPIEILRLLSGFSLPLLLFGHFVTTRMAMEIYAHDLSYARTITSLLSSGTQGWQLALMAPGWVHGCLGLWITLRRFPLLLALKPALLGFAMALPLLSAAGFGLMARELTAKGLNLAVIEVSMAERAALGQFVATMTNGYLLLLLLTLVLGQVRIHLQNRGYWR